MTPVQIDINTRAGDLTAFLVTWALDLAQSAPEASAVAEVLNAAIAEAVAPSQGAPADAAVETYKAALMRLGRNPNRYRISSDALLRRARRDGLPTILPLVDLTNALSLRSGWPIGCYDLGKIQGLVTLRQGRESETMATLGKGEMDVFKLPLLADGAGAFGSTVSDSVRCCVTEATQAPLFVMYGYGEADEAALTSLIAEACAAVGAVFGERPRLIAG